MPLYMLLQDDNEVVDVRLHDEVVSAEDAPQKIFGESGKHMSAISFDVDRIPDDALTMIGWCNWPNSDSDLRGALNNGILGLINLGRTSSGANAL